MNIVQIYHAGDDAEAGGAGLQENRESLEPSRASYFLALTHH